MKKTYIKPSVECYNVNAHSIIAASPNSLALDEGTEITNENKSSFDILGREDNAGSNVWDSEW